MDDHEPIGLLIGAVRRRIKQAVGSRVRRYHLTTQQFWVVVAIAARPGLSLGELATQLRMDNPTASRVIATLLSRHWVEVRGDAADGRRARLFLRAGAQGRAKELEALATEVRAAVVQGLNAAEQAALRHSLRIIIANMDRLQTRLNDPPARSRVRRGRPRDAALALGIAPPART